MARIDVSIGPLYGTAVGLLAAILRGEVPAGEIRRQAVTPVLVNGPSLPLWGEFLQPFGSSSIVK